MPNPAAALFRRVTWTQMLWVGQEALKRGSAVGRELGPNGRERAVFLVRKSNGRPGNLTKREREELMRLAGSVWDAALHPERH